MFQKDFFECSFNQGNITDYYGNDKTVTFSSPSDSFPSPKDPTYNFSFNIPQEEPVNFSYNLTSNKSIEIIKSGGVIGNGIYNLNFSKTTNPNLFDVAATFPVGENTTSSGNFSISRNQSPYPTEWVITQINSQSPSNFFNITLSSDSSYTYKFSWSWTTYDDSVSPLGLLAPMILGASDLFHKYNFPYVLDKTIFIGLAWTTQLTTTTSP